MRVMISQPMNGLTVSEIEETQMRAYRYLTSLGHEVPDTFFCGLLPVGVKNSGLYGLGLSILAMSECDAVFLCKGWEDAKGCLIEHNAAKSYGLKLMYE